ncbi:hypothetical protein D0X99_18045 [Algoriphagus lacus]|uniref:Uncharacterized protein n=1 Tax=Algoriphagus lacus TaxID=2056311 RepID=A0A418PMI1_9BACT|nr:hypothetical protein [Algoriphagus lacus]RIW12700.1 hypothetical protein D0X99_18045 [Algoriphagus lacus]
MEKDRLDSLLAEVFGHLQPDEAQDPQLWKEGLPLFAKSLLVSKDLTVRSDSFSFERSQLFSKERIKPEQMERIREVVEKVKLNEKEPELRPFVREVPVRSTQIRKSVPAWAAGAKVEKTIGPLIREDGRPVLIDFYKVVKLLGLYQQNSPLPVILFQAEFQEKRIKAINTPPVEVAKDYKIVAGSVWIRADMLAQNAPANRYAGLKVSSGQIQLSQNPVLQNEKLVLGAQTGVQVSLVLQQAEPVVYPPKKHGKDAVDTKVNTPQSFTFSFTGASKAQISTVGEGSAEVYGQKYAFQQKNAAPSYHAQISRLLIPMSCDQSGIKPAVQKGLLLGFLESAPLKSAAWAIPAAELDVNNPLEAAGTGGFALEGKEGLKCYWQGLQAKNLKLQQPLFLVDPGRIGMTDLAGEGEGAFQEFEHWKDEQNPHGTSLSVFLGKKTSLIYNSLAEGVELIVSTVNSVHQVDRPVLVSGLPVGVKTKDSLLILAGSETKNLLYLIDDNILWDNKLPFEKVPKFKSIALALENALFTVTPVNGAMIFGECTLDWKRISKSETFLVFGLLGYLPTLPDPYLANLGYLKRLTSRGKKDGIEGIISWLVCQISQAPRNEQPDKVKVSFHFGPESNDQQNAGSGFGMLANDQPTVSPSSTVVASQPAGDVAMMRSRINVPKPLPPYEQQLIPHIQKYQNEFFTLLDVSSNANQLGVSLGTPLPVRIKTGVAVGRGEHVAHIEQTSNQMFGVEGMEVVVRSSAARLFMLPQVAWEPVFNLTPPGENVLGDPPVGFNYYPNDGGPTRIANYHSGQVPLAPRPLVKYTLEEYINQKTAVDALFTLPFGLKALAKLSHDEPRESKKPELNLVQPSFPNDLVGGIQIRAIAKDYGKDAMVGAGPDSPMFKGFTVQLANILGMNGQPTNDSTLGRSVTRIFNGEFFADEGTPHLLKKRGVPLSKIDFTGYGASTFSNWLSPRAAVANTSQARFDIMLGRTGHEVIQVKSILYPWGIRVVRTITLFRTGSGYVYRTDSGWQAESDGLFDFRYSYIDKSKPKVEDPETGEMVFHTETIEPYELHTGAVRGLYNVTNIQEDGNIAEYKRDNARVIGANEFHVDEFGEWSQNGATPIEQSAILTPVWFDADVKLDNLVQGHKNGLTPSKKILGYVQISPPNVTIPTLDFKELLEMQGGLIGGDVDCIMDLNKSGQMMRITRFDVSPSVKQNNNPSDSIFVAAARGNVLLPKDGSWSIVQHETGTGEVAPLPSYVPVPVIREGKWKAGNELENSVLTGKLLRVAHPLEILRNPEADTFNFGLLQSTATQKALFLTPSFEFGTQKLLSKTPLAFADAYRLMNSNSIFPNIGDGYTNLGKAVALVSGIDINGNPVEAFKTKPIMDGSRQVFELLDLTVKKEGAEIIDRGFKLLSGEANDLLNKAIAFDVPSFDPLYLVDMDALKIYIEYKAKETKKTPTNYVDSKLNFDVDSFANDLKDTWKSRVNNLAMVVDLGSFKRLMTIKGNFDAQKGKESGYEGGPNNPNKLQGLPTPEVEFSEDLQPVIDLLQLLASMSTGNYAEVMKKGLQIAMSNAGEIWEYKFEATKEIPLVRFPPEENLYNSPQCPLRLEAGLSLGVYFNAALKVTTDPTQLLPTAGGFIQFKGGLEVMCMTVGGATIYAIGAVDLKLACDTKTGPSLLMKFGFGASISVGLPVIGNVSVTYMVGCEIYASSNEIAVTAFMLFKGHASLAGGLVSVTIYIEASGTVKRIGGPDGKTDCTASVTFGLDISICFVINISFEETWQESRQIA